MKLLQAIPAVATTMALACTGGPGRGDAAGVDVAAILDRDAGASPDGDARLTEVGTSTDAADVTPDLAGAVACFSQA